MYRFPKKTIGLDISDSAISAVEVCCKKRKLNIVNYNRIELEPGIVEDNCIILDKKAFRESLEKLLQTGKKGPFRTKNVIIAIPEEKTFSHTLKIPYSNINDEEFILNAAKDFIPIDLTEAIYDYEFLNKSESKKESELNFAAVQKNVIESITDIFNEIGIQVSHIDIDTKSLVRACFHHDPEAGDFMVIEIDKDKTVLGSINKSGLLYSFSVNIGSRQIICDKTKSISKDAFKQLSDKISDFIKISEDQHSFSIKTIYLVGIGSKFSDMLNIFKEIFPSMKIEHDLGFEDFKENAELYYTKAIGLAIKAISVTSDKKEINLLPYIKKEEVFREFLYPFITKISFILFFIATALAIFSGFYMAKAYINSAVSEKDIKISQEQLKNPYIHDVVKTNSEQNKLNNQIKTILQNVMPGGFIMEKLDSYNSKDISLINIDYKLNNNINDIRLRAKTSSRKNTEIFVEKLKKDIYFSKIVSPLSNLAGKSESFIDIDLIPDIKVIINDFEKSNIKNTNDSPSANTKVIDTKNQTSSVKK